MSTTNPTLDAWNALDAATAAATILPCNGSQAWATNLTALRPFHTVVDLTCTADIVWRSLDEPAWQQAFDSHPRIGERHAKAATAASLALSSAEQSTAQSAARLTADTQAALAAANAAYEQKFGRIFIVCATGKTAAEMLTILRTRLANDPHTELLEASEQQRRITQLRLRKWLANS
jgi:2-oxo-4-hydroxy-4-carboxy-5-ureidoimidazoline decarboxylase